MTNLEAIRKLSLATARQLGYPTNDSLPSLGREMVTRSCDDVVDRVLGMLCVAACAYGFNHEKAITWLHREAKTEFLTPSESRFLRAKVGDCRQFIEQIEGIRALAWSIGAIDDIDFGKPCAEDFVRILPDLKGDQRSEEFRSNANIRPDEEIVAACDLAYCIHWAVRELHVRSLETPGKVQPYVVVERRRALEWLLTSSNWEAITLDT